MTRSSTRPSAQAADPFPARDESPADIGNGARRILLLSASAELGGAERTLLDVIAAAKSHAPDLVLGVIAAAEGPLVAEARALGAEVTVLRWGDALGSLGDSGLQSGALGRLRLASRLAGAVPALGRYVQQLRRAVDTWQPDIVHSNGFKMHVLAAMVRPRAARVVWHLHDFVTNRVVMARLLRALSGRCSLAIANSRAVADDAVIALGGGTAVRVVLNAVDTARFNASGPRDDLDAVAGVAPAPVGTIRIGLVATLAHWKGHEVFLRAVAELPRDRAVRAYVVSGPVYQTTGSQLALEALRESATRLGIADRVAFTGFRPDAARVMRALDVVVHASTAPEPFGLVIAEAMASGRAVVFSAAGGALELAVPEVEALAHDPGDAAVLARQLVRLIADPGLRERLGAAARVAAESRFSRARLGREIVAAWRSAVLPRA